MTTYTVANGYDTMAYSGAPTANYEGGTPIQAGSFVGTEYGYVFLPLPADLAGQTVASATLTGYANAGSLASGTVSVRPITSNWSASTLNYNKAPTVGSATNTTISGFTTGASANLDVTAIVQAAAGGAPWYGVRLGSTASGYFDFASFESATPSWTLTIVTTTAPAIPTTLVPNGSVVASGAPVLQCDFTDNGLDDMAAMNVQVSTTTSFTSPAYDHTLTTTVPIFDLAANGFTAVSSGTTRYWRVRVQDSNGNWSGWSSAASFTYRTQPTITILTPASGVLWDPTSDIIATTSTNMSAYRVQITAGTDRTAIRYDSGRLPANPAALTTIDVALPEEYEGRKVFVDDSTYQLHVQAWDANTGRQSTTGSPSYVESWTTFHFDDDLTQTPIATLVASQPDPSPAVTLTWTRASAPDGWVVHRDGKIIARLDPSDVISGASTYSWADSHPTQWVSHTYAVRALTRVSGTMKRSPSGPTATIIPKAHGVWLFTQDGQRVALDETDVTQVTVNDRRTTYKPINVRYDVDTVSSFEGLSGTITGTIPTALDDTVSLNDATAVLLSIKESPAKYVRLVYGTFSGRVLLRNVSVTPDPRSTPAVPLAKVSFGVNQVGDFGDVT